MKYKLLSASLIFLNVLMTVCVMALELFCSFLIIAKLGLLNYVLCIL